MTIKNVTIGDKFKKCGTKNRNDVYTVVDFYTTCNMSGEIVNQVVVAEHEFCGQVMKTEHPFATVVRGKIA